MINTLITVFNTCISIFLLNQYFMQNYTETYNDICIKYLYNAIYLFSKCQIFYNKLLETRFFKRPKKAVRVDDIQYIKIESVLRICNGKSLIQTSVRDDGFYIYSDSDVDGNINHVIYQSYPMDLQYDVSDISFISLEVKSGSEFFKVHLKTESYNFYVVDNVFDKNFFIYYLVNFCNGFNLQKINIGDLSVKLVDHNVEIKEIPISRETIRLTKDGYIIEPLVIE
jgi:hypothetical protein